MQRTSVWLLLTLWAASVAGQDRAFLNSRILLSSGTVGPADMVVEEYYRRINEETLFAGTCEWTGFTSRAFRCSGIYEGFDSRDVFLSVLYSFTFRADRNLSTLRITNEQANEVLNPEQILVDLLGVYWPEESLAQRQARIDRQETEAAAAQAERERAEAEQAAQAERDLAALEAYLAELETVMEEGEELIDGELREQCLANAAAAIREMGEDPERNPYSHNDLSLLNGWLSDLHRVRRLVLDMQRFGSYHRIYDPAYVVDLAMVRNQLPTLPNACQGEDAVAWILQAREDSRAARERQEELERLRQERRDQLDR